MPHSGSPIGSPAQAAHLSSLLPGRSRIAILASLFGITLLAWMYLIVMALSMDDLSMTAGAVMRIRSWSGLDFLLMFLMWAVMMVGMMVPTAVPMTLIYAAVARKAASQSTPLAPTALFVAGYLVMWCFFSVAATLTQWVLDQASLLSPMMVSNSPALGAGLLIAAGIYQWTPLKDACLQHCRAPAHFFAQHWRSGAAGAFRLGLEHGAFCLGCCWVLMGLLFLGGVMNLLWIAAITFFVLLEKLSPWGVQGGRVVGAAMVLVGILALVGSSSYGAGLMPIQEPSDHPEANGRVLTDAEGQPLPLESYQEIAHFLMTAQVVSSDEIEDGVTGVRKVLLEKDNVRVHAVFRDVRINESRTLPTGTQVPFRDDYIFECAAYELSRLLGLDNIPPTVEREIQGQKGSLQLWIEGAVTETERRNQGNILVDQESLSRSWQVMLVFDNLIFNDDRNRGNYLYDPKGNLWMVDHTRSFRTDDELPYPSGILYSERRLWEGLQKLESTVLRAHLQNYLGPSELESLIKRKDRLVEYIQEMIAERGEEDVPFSF